jgi:hypothetical protein
MGNSTAQPRDRSLVARGSDPLADVAIDTGKTRTAASRSIKRLARGCCRLANCTDDKRPDATFNGAAAEPVGQRFSGLVRRPF